MAERGDQSAIGPFTFPYGFNENKTVILVHYFNNKTLRIDPDNEEEVDYKGGSGQFATWDVELDKIPLVVGNEDPNPGAKLKTVSFQLEPFKLVEIQGGVFDNGFKTRYKDKNELNYRPILLSLMSTVR